MEAGWRLGHRPALDGLRGVAVLLVVAYHGCVLAGVDPFPSAGTVGVTMFFALSGFLISALLLEELDQTGRVSFSGFYRRRARRLLPALVVVVAACLVVTAADGGFVSLASAGASVFYVQNWYGIAHPGSLDALQHTWSLSIEEQFYLVWPVLLIGLVRLGRRAVVAACLLGGVASLVARADLWGTVDSWRIYAGTDTRADGLLIGCALAAAMPWLRRPKVLVVLGVSVLAPAMLMQGYGYHVVAPALAALGSAALILRAASDGLPALSATWLRWFGRRSYGLYLWHVPVMLLAQSAGLPALIAVTLFAAVSLILTEASWRWVETPFLRRPHRGHRLDRGGFPARGRFSPLTITQD